MQLLLIRHAAAVNIAHSDSERGLTDRGRTEFEAVVRGLKTLELSLTTVLHSPFLRARQTAELCHPLLESQGAPDGEGAIQMCQELGNAPSKRLLAQLDPMHASVALVGHEPWMSELLARLTTGDARSAVRLGFHKGSVAVLRGDPAWGAMTLHGFYPPEVTRTLGDLA